MIKKLSHTITIALVIVSCGLTYLIEEYIHHRITETTDHTIDMISANSSAINSDPDIESIKSYRFINPNVKSEPKNESPSFNRLKTKLSSYIEGLKNSHKLIDASVYVRYYGHGAMLNLNPGKTYSPGSMIKVINLILYLKMSEESPGLMERKIIYGTPSYSIPTQTFNSRQIEAGKEYTIKDLLKYMIVYSDNKATCYLVANMGNELYFKMMNDLKIPMQQTKDGACLMTASQYSEVLKMLYSSSYLTPENSEFALSLLNQSDFSLGLTDGLPNNIKVAHKFGEAGSNGQFELHESGLVYMDYAPYVITIMTRGYKIKDLPPVLSNISKMVYDHISQMEE